MKSQFKQEARVSKFGLDVSECDPDEDPDEDPGEPKRDSANSGFG